MTYKTVKTALLNLLATNAAGRFQVIGAPRQTTDANDAASLRMVTAYYESGDFDKGRAGMFGNVQHDATFRIDLMVAGRASIDVATMQAQGATQAEYAAALADMTEANDHADALMDDLIDVIWHIITDPANDTLGLPDGTIANRWIQQAKKGQPDHGGALVTMGATMALTCRMVETPTTAENPVPGTGIDNIIPLTADKSGATLDSAKQGAKVGT